MCLLHWRGPTDSVVVGAAGWVMQYRVGGEHLLQAGLVLAVMDRVVMAVVVGWCAGSGVGMVAAYQGAVGVRDLLAAGMRVDAEDRVQVGLVVPGHGHGGRDERWRGAGVVGRATGVRTGDVGDHARPGGVCVPSGAGRCPLTGDGWSGELAGWLRLLGAGRRVITRFGCSAGHHLLLSWLSVVAA